MSPEQPLPFVTKDFSTLVKDLMADMASGRGGRPVVADPYEGSVVRTLTEAFARELAVAYEQLDIVYRSAYLDSAEGVALDNVVALLALERRQPGHLQGMVNFSRNQPALHDIYIPAGTWVAGTLPTGDSAPLCATVEEAVLPQGQVQVSVPVLSLEPSQDQVEASSVQVVMPRPVAGIDQVSLGTDLLPRQSGETDEELRGRARIEAKGLNGGTCAALEQAVRSLGIAGVKVLEPDDDPQLLPGEVFVVMEEAHPVLLEQARRRVQELRPAGVRVGCGPATQVLVQITANLRLNAELSTKEQAALIERIRQALCGYFSQLRAGESVRQSKLRALLTSEDAVVDCAPIAAFNLMEPYVLNAGVPVAQSGRFLLASGDVHVGPRERVNLDMERLPVRLTLETLASLMIDVTVSLPPGRSDAGLQEALTQRLTPWLQEQAKQAQKTGAGALGLSALQAEIAGALGGGAAASVNVVMLHTLDGRVLDWIGSEATQGVVETFLPREQLRLRSVVVKPTKGGA
jgi:hypothetical protein